jgi:hypothetical protein
MVILWANFALLAYLIYIVRSTLGFKYLMKKNTTAIPNIFFLFYKYGILPLPSLNAVRSHAHFATKSQAQKNSL